MLSRDHKAHDASYLFCLVWLTTSLQTEYSRRDCTCTAVLPLVGWWRLVVFFLWQPHRDDQIRQGLNLRTPSSSFFLEMCVFTRVFKSASSAWDEFSIISLGVIHHLSGTLNWSSDVFHFHWFTNAKNYTAEFTKRGTVIIETEFCATLLCLLQKCDWVNFGNTPLFIVQYIYIYINIKRQLYLLLVQNTTWIQVEKFLVNECFGQIARKTLCGVVSENLSLQMVPESEFCVRWVLPGFSPAVWDGCERDRRLRCVQCWLILTEDASTRVRVVITLDMASEQPLPLSAGRVQRASSSQAAYSRERISQADLHTGLFFSFYLVYFSFS